MNMELLSSDDLKRMEELADLFKTLGHPYKLRIFKYLCECSYERMRVKDIYTALGTQQATTSRHLNGLKNKGLLKRTKEDRKVYYELNLENELVKCLSHCIMAIN